VSGFAGLTPCVHCGFCLQACPTYLATADEADSPRGRIVLMRSLERGELAADDPGLQLHLDRCLGCRGCEPVCPSGVSYGPALEAARERMAAVRQVPPPARVLLATMADRAIGRPAMWLARIVRPLAGPLAGRGGLGFALGMLAASRPATLAPKGRHGRARGLDGPRDPAPAAAARSAPAPSGAPAAVFQGCIQAGLFGHVNRAAARTLAANGRRVVAVEGQGCCGALHAHAGLLPEARALARANVAAFAAHPGVTVAVTAAGCGAVLRSYGDLLAGDPLEPVAREVAGRVRDITELLADAGPRRGAPVPLRVAYDPPCHLLHAQRVADPPRAVLAAVPELEVVAHDEPEQCCGGAGIYGLSQPEISRAVLDRKIAALTAAAPDIVATGNPGCTMQIGAGLRAAGSRIGVVHPVELLDASYAAAGFYDGRDGGHGPA
jgi:glycolate oxidase iron-sulfur subunit